MLRIVSHRKIAVIIVGVILLGYGIVTQVNKLNVAAIGGKSETNSYYDQALVRTYLPDMQIASNNFYKEYFTINPTIEAFDTYIKEIVKRDALIVITFVASPFIGAHNSVGIDEITFTVNVWGDVHLEEFHHVISYSLPENLSNLSIKPIPGQYE